MSICVDRSIQYRDPEWPNFLIPADGWSDEATLPVGVLSENDIEKLCESLRAHCRSKREAV